MSQKNRPTLKAQFADFINRIAPFDGNPLIQKTEHLQVEDDMFDSLLNKVDASVLINSPGALIGLDFESIDLYRINTSGSVDTVFTLTPSNIGTGQIGRIEIVKKSNDVFAFSNAVITPISNLNQTGTALSYYVHNVNGTLIASSSLTIPKSDNISDNTPDQLATSKAIVNLKNNRSAKVQDAFIALTAPATGDYTIDTSNAFVRTTDQGYVQFKGFVETTRIAPAPFVRIFQVAAPQKPSRDMSLVISSGIGSSIGGELLTSNGEFTIPGEAGTNKYFIDGLTYVL